MKYTRFIILLPLVVVMSCSTEIADRGYVPIYVFVVRNNTNRNLILYDRKDGSRWFYCGVNSGNTKEVVVRTGEGGLKDPFPIDVPYPSNELCLVEAFQDAEAIPYIGNFKLIGIVENINSLLVWNRPLSETKQKPTYDLVIIEEHVITNEALQGLEN